MVRINLIGLLQHPVEEAEVIGRWLEGRRKGKIKLQVPQRGDKKQLVDTVAENARQNLEQMKIKQLAAPRELEAALAELQKELHLAEPPQRIEAYDISNIQGQAAVGSMAVFESGKPKPGYYRRFKIKTIKGADDYAMLQEVLKRRFKRLHGENAGESWAVVPDLVLIDGGKGQLNAALAVMKEPGATSIPVVSLAKEREEIFVPGRSAPLTLLRTSPALRLLQRLRDEAHRFAISYFQRVRKRETFVSIFDNIDGVGLKRRRALMKHFGSIDKIREASVKEIASVKGMTEKLAQRVKETFHAG